MKHFKFLVINIIAFGSLFFLISLLFPGQVVTAKTVSIAAGKEKVLAKLNDTSHWKEWNLFVSDDAVTVSAGNNTDTLLSFSFENKNHQQLQTHFNIHQEPTNTILLNCAMVETLPWYKPWRKFSAMVLNKDIAAAMDSSLNNFKIQVETIK
jgi:hypothetical protein